MRKVVWMLTGLFLALTIGCTFTAEAPIYLPNQNAKPAHFKPGSEPDGINGMRWETPLSAFDGMTFLRRDFSYGGIDFYLRTGDGLKLADGNVKPVQYGFWRDKFYVGLVTAKNLSEWNVLKKTVLDKFGEGAKPFSNKEEYLWVGRNASMSLQYDDVSKTGTYYVRCTSMENQMTKVELWPEKKPE